MRTQPVWSWLLLTPYKNQGTSTDFMTDYNVMPQEEIKTAGKNQSALH